MNIFRLSGLTDFPTALRLQEDLVSAHLENPLREDDLLLLEHEGVYTIGRTRDHSSLHPDAVHTYPIFEINRGGQATYHGPGQLVGYPISDLNRRGRDIHAYILSLEEALIRTCALFSVQASLREGLVGVWVGERKLASIGVGVKKWISMHGFAINITKQSLPPFQEITPCGIQQVHMTCLEDEMPDHIFKDRLLDRFAEEFISVWRGDA